MKTIWKFPLEIIDFQKIEMPKDADVMSDRPGQFTVGIKVLGRKPRYSDESSMNDCGGK